MARIDYGQVPCIDPPCPCKKWNIKIKIFQPECKRDIVEGSEKWISTKYLNSKRRFPEGSIALVGQRESTGQWVVIKEALRIAS